MNESSIDWTEYKDEDIQRFIRELEAEQNRRRAEKRKALKAQISDMVKAHGLSLSELFPQPGRTTTKGQSKGKSQAEAPKVKYRNPDNASQTWTGMGRKPAWVVEALASGKRLEDLRV